MVKGAKHSWYDWDDDFIWLRLQQSGNISIFSCESCRTVSMQKGWLRSGLSSSSHVPFAACTLADVSVESQVIVDDQEESPPGMLRQLLLMCRV